MGIKYPQVKVKLAGEDGNAFAVMGATRRAMRKAGLSEEQIEEYLKEAMSRDWRRLASLQAAYPHLTLDPGAGWTCSSPESIHGMRGIATWNLEQMAYVVEAGSEQAARLIGYGVAYDDGLEVVWHGTRATAAGTWAAQFTICGGTDA